MIPPQEFLTTFIPEDRFKFILEWELRHAIRDSHHLSIILVRLEGMDEHLHLLSAIDLLYKGLRDTDHRGILEDKKVAIILRKADADDLDTIKIRISPTLRDHPVCYRKSPCGYRLKIGGSCFPVDAVTADDLLRLAERNCTEL